MNSIHKLTELFRRFPGVGPRQAKRFVYFLLSQHNGYTDELIRELSALRKAVRTCTGCFRYFSPTPGTQERCLTCAEESRDSKLLMVVEKDVDIDSIEKSKTYDGYYFVLGGPLPILEKEPRARLRVAELEKRLAGENGPAEVILAFSLSPDSDHTREYLMEALRPLQKKRSFTMSTLGRGLSTGSELEYADSETIKNAFKNRA